MGGPSDKPDKPDKPDIADIYAQVGRRVAALRHALGLKQREIAVLARVENSYISRIEHGSKHMSLHRLERVAAALEVPLWRLFADDRLTLDEKAWDARSRGLGARVRGLPQQDLVALEYVAMRLHGGAASGFAPSTPAAAPQREAPALKAAESQRTWRAAPATRKPRRKPKR